MIKVNIISNNKNFPLLRQIPGDNNTWGDCIFTYNENSYNYDFLVVYEDLIEPVELRCNKRNTLLITGEPPTVRKYNSNFTKQFYHVLTCHENIKCNNRMLRQQCLPWMAGLKYNFDNENIKIIDYMSYDLLYDFNFDPNKKEDKIAVIFSKKNITRHHKEREKFILKLKEKLGGKLDIYGVGFNPVNDKFDVLSRYKYSLVIENCAVKDYWSEKLSDAYICGNLPFYYGCANIIEYFQNDELVYIDLKDLNKTLFLIENAIDCDLYQQRLWNIQNARYKILKKYNLFSVLNEIVSSYYLKTHIADSIMINPYSFFQKKRIRSTFVKGKSYVKKIFKIS